MQISAIKFIVLTSCLLYSCSSTTLKEKNQIVCPGHAAYCPDDSTCCLTKTEEYGCCPIPNAVCCNDHIHCCPELSVCNVEAGTCVRGSKHSPIYRKQSAKFLIDIDFKKNIELYHSRPRLPPSMTFHTSSPIFTPIINSQLDLMSNTNRNENDLVNFFQKYGHHSHSNRQNQKEFSVLAITCPDHKSQCPPSTTCCLLADETEYGCCPTANAVCCKDHLHCCPENTKCDLQAGICLSTNGKTLPLLKKVPATRIISKPSIKTTAAQISCNTNEIRSDSSDSENKSAENKITETYCLSGSKCCASNLSPFTSKSSISFCCPYSNGVCCSKGTHCCPQGFRCSSTLQTCIASKDDDSIEDSTVSVLTSLIKSSKAMTKTKTGNVEVTCGDGSKCDYRNTCCPIRNSITNVIDSYRCCPLSNGKCCGGDSCCPRGYHCTPGKRCEKPSIKEMISEFLLTPNDEE